MMNLSGRNYSSAFTQIQWQELELQALIYKYMVSGIPIPLDLIYSLKRSLDSSLSSSLFPHHPIGWGCFEMGFGKKCDPEPGRCRRTDGKKWRCSKEAYPDSKYCEKHMHRGRNRSRKPVEVTSATSRTTTTTIATTNSAASTRNFPTNISFSQLYHHPSSSSSSPISRLSDFSYTSSQNTNPQLLLYSGSNKDYRGVNEKKEGLDHERDFFPDSLGSSTVAPLSMGTYKEEQQPHCFILGTDFKSQAEMKNEKHGEIQKPLHHFFEEWPIKNTESWLDLSSTPNC